MFITGVDLSHHNKILDWSKVGQTNIQFIIHKITEGVDFIDSTFYERYPYMRRPRFVLGAYHFWRPISGLAQAGHFLDIVSQYKDIDFYALDIETWGKNPRENTLQVLEWLGEVSKTGKKIYIYTNVGTWESHYDTENLDILRFSLWVANWTTCFPKIPYPWHTFSFWQVTNRGRVAGIYRYCDLDLYIGTREELEKEVAYG